MIKKLRLLDKRTDITLDYDNTILFTEKSDARMTYKNDYGYCPGVGSIGRTIVYVENRNGNSDAQTLQDKTIERMFDALAKAKIKINRFRADGASYQLRTIWVASERANKIYIRARKDHSVMRKIASITDWKEVKSKEGVGYYGSIEYTPFIKRAKEHKLQHLLKQYRLVVYKTPNKDGQLDLFTGEACEYSAIITTDREMSDFEVVQFYNQRGAAEKEFDILKNDFGWNNMPFSKLEQNSVFLIICAICRNLYDYIIRLFSKRTNILFPNFRIKKFIFRFICIPAKWVKSARTKKLRLYGNLSYRT
jgi:transposase